MRKTLADFLTAKGYETFTAKNGADGLAMLGRYSVNVALIDLDLPDISGMEILERISADFKLTETIILTGNTGLDSAIEATNKGAFSYLLKPVDLDQLVLNVKRAIEKQEDKERTARHGFELERINAELKTLYEISLVLNRTIDLDGLLSGILQALVEMELFRVEQRAAVFFVEGDLLRLVSHTGLSEAQLELCASLKIEECLCRLAATENEIIISKNSREDARHTIQPDDLPVHGDVILPLKIADRIIGVISLQTRPDAEVDSEAIRLLSTIANQIGIAVNNAMLYEEAKTFAFHDPLTGLPNRRFMQIQMDKCIETAKRYREKLSAIMLDIDHFKEYNDSYGHVEGDNLLVKIADLLKRELRSSDFVFRYGGEEFLIILPRTDLATAGEVAERLRREVESKSEVTISLGVSLYREFMWDKESLVNAVDAALYQAKQKGRNKVVVNP
jgi:diguanylate cyclase (GGDEF)-like protein